MSVKFDNIIPLNQLTEAHLVFLDENSHLLSDVPFFPIMPEDKARLIGSDYDEIEKAILPKNIKQEFKKYLRAKNSLSHITELASKFKETANNIGRVNNRFTFMSDKFLQGVGIDGMGGSAKVERHEIDFIEDVRSEARKRGARCVDIDEDDEDAKGALRQSINSMLGWRNINMGGIPFGTPIQVSMLLTRLIDTTDKPKPLNDIINNLPDREGSKGLKYIFGYNHQGELESSEFKRIFDTSLRSAFQLIKNNNTIEQAKSVSGTIFSETSNNLDKIYNGTDAWIDNSGTKDNDKKLVLAIYVIFYRYLCNVNSFYESLKGQLVASSNKNSLDKLSKSVKTSLNEFDKYIRLCLINYFGITGHTNITELIKVDTKEVFKVSENITFILGKDVSISRSYLCSRENYLLSYNVDKLNQGETIERLIKFLTFQPDEEIRDPYTKKLIAVGAPIQNNTIYMCTLKEANAYYRALSESRKIFVKYFKRKIEVMKSGISAGKLIEYKDLIEAHLNYIQESSPISKEIKCTEMILSLKERYGSLRRKEYEYGSQEAVLKLRRTTSLKNKNSNASTLEKDTINLERIAVGLEAETLKAITNLEYNIFLKQIQAYRKTISLCPNLLQQIMEQYTQIDMEIKQKMEQDLIVKKKEIEAKYGTLLKNQKVFANVQIKPAEAPQEYSAFITNFFQGKLLTGFAMPTTAPSTFGPNKKFVPTPKVLQIETDSFWERMRTALNGKTIYIVVAGAPNFSNSEVFFLDIINSMIYKKEILIRSNFATSEVFRRDISRRGYILLSSTPIGIKNPNEWRYMPRQTLNNMFRTKRIQFIRLLMFNLIVNNQFFNIHTNNVLPPNMKLSRAMQVKCQRSVGAQYDKCNFIISRAQLGVGLQKASEKVPGLEGIDYASGASYADRNPNREQAEMNIFRKGT
jgi:hypothetical protein